ncbi:hypothetical protein D9619_004623 [Psilocybe cf. subviscida]|uniref:nicotinate phosphoribosyltransferase n=1 Tax=Psilocybe cf. subviscida TaxID=2480587 RepID=A0A8H5BRU7_9AGAR|nr:hypothetical protein D9619_004623 [Psilocybe cf. subviscida]
MSAALSVIPAPLSILDTDLYKLTMQQAVLSQFPDVQASYRFTNRNKATLFSRQSIERFRTAISDFATLELTPPELSWLERACPFLTPTYLSYLSAYRYKPEQVKVTYEPVTPDNLHGHVEIVVTGPWVETILWEVPLMATLSETFFQSVVTDWNYDNQYAQTQSPNIIINIPALQHTPRRLKPLSPIPALPHLTKPPRASQLAFSKAQSLSAAGCRFSEFGTRRRRSYQTQDTVCRALVDATRGTQALSGTSNVAALQGYEHANSTALRLWENVYTGASAPLISLTDTFSTDAFMKASVICPFCSVCHIYFIYYDFVADPELAYRWAGLRQDSGDPFAFAPRVKAMYESLGIPYESKAIIFSDSLSVEKCIALQKQCNELGFKKVSYGIGTFFTNDFKAASTGEKSKALNIVIKLASVDGKPCVKISDDLTKNTGDKDTVKFVKDMHCLV